MAEKKISCSGCRVGCDLLLPIIPLPFDPLGHFHEFCKNSVDCNSNLRIPIMSRGKKWLKIRWVLSLKLALRFIAFGNYTSHLLVITSWRRPRQGPRHTLFRAE